MSYPDGLIKQTIEGQEIIVVDYRNKPEEQLFAIAEALQEMLLAENKPNLRLVHVKGVDPSSSFRVFLRKMGKTIGHIPSKVAVIGLSPTKRVVMQAYNKMLGGSMRFYDDEKDGIHYLLTD
ncbi:hypothetical protein [Marinoscillum sp.]|uniref:hypothetical protein n=1 Tax=Marinoscillum sp. TaxID=2024838 RepID=UPI003BAB27B2